jgi:hypothetical protein
MPSLGFLKKKRTKDSTGSHDLDSPTSPVKETQSSSTSQSPPSKAASSAFSFGRKPSASHDSAAASESTQTSSAHSKPAADSMNPAVHQQQQAHASPQPTPEPYQQTQHNAPSIQNLIHPTNTPQPYHSQHSQPGQQLPRSANGGMHTWTGLPSQPTPAVKPQVRATKGKYTLTDFTIQRTLGTGSFGRVHLVQSKHNQRFYAVKVLKKAQVVKMKQVEHTNDERRMLQQVKHPFLITLWGTFQDSKNLYMVMDFVEGGELFSLLRKSQVG